LSSHSFPEVPNIQAQFELLKQVKKSDFFRLKKQLTNHKRVLEQLSVNNKALAEKTAPKLMQLAKQVHRTAQYIEQSINEKLQKLNNLPKIIYPDGLPIAENAAQISKAISDNQVVIIAGETGSGKTTQIPKICLELGRGVDGLIGHTQPRRIAARTVANRIAEE